MKAQDNIQQQLTQYAIKLNYDGLSPETIHAAKVRTIDTLGALIAGLPGEPCAITRNLAAQMPDPCGATIIGTRTKTTPDMAAFVNATTARYLEITDSYHWPGSSHGHPADTVTAAFAAAEHANASGRDFITALVLAYEVFLRLCDAFHNEDFDPTNLCCAAAAIASGKLFGLTPDQLSHAISMAVVPNIALKQVRLGHLSMYKAVASGQAARAGVFAALLARAGMEGPHLPFEGKAGWCKNVAREHFSLDTMGGGATPFKILNTQIKNRMCAGNCISAALAAEKIAPLKNLKEVQTITVEVDKYAKDHVGTGEYHWSPTSRETADHSIPYIVAVTLMDGAVKSHSFNDAHLWNPELRSLMKTITVLENENFTSAYNRQPQEHHARVVVVTGDGQQMVGTTGGDKDDLSAPKSDTQIEEKFRGLAEDALGAKRTHAVLRHLWNLEKLETVAGIPPALCIA